MDNELLLGRKKVRDVQHLLVKDPTLVSPDADLDSVCASIVSDPKTRHVYVVDENRKLLGAIRMNKMVEYLFPYTAMVEQGTKILKGKSTSPDAKIAADVMAETELYVKESTRLSEVARIFMRERINELPVVDDDMVVTGQINFYEIIIGYLNDKKGNNQ